MRGSCEPVRIDMLSEMACSHVLHSNEYTCEQLRSLSEKTCSHFNNCSYNGKNRWLCLARDCRMVLCNNHTEAHYETNKGHAVFQNLSSERIWCNTCNQEVRLPEEDCSDNGSSLDSSKPKGLQNIGNTCYMNAALQALCNIPAIRQHFTHAHLPPDDKKHCLSRNFQRLIEDMCEPDERPYLVPNGILQGIRNMHPMFRGYHQHDTQEFLRCFMDQLHDELKEQVPQLPRHVLSNYPIREEEQEPEDMRGDQSEAGTSSGNQSDNDYETADSGVEEGDRASLNRKHSLSSSPIPRTKIQSRSRGPLSPGKQKRKPPKYRSIISDVFDGKLLSSVECLYCNKLSARVETFQDLSLPIPSRDHVTMLHQGTLSPQNLAACSDVYKGRTAWMLLLWEWVKSWFWGPTVSLHDCLSAFFSADELKGDNMYSCEKCSKLRNGMKFSKVLDLPEVLCIHLKRFRHELAFSSKISNFVSFPLTDLDMRPYLNKDCKNKETSYDLSAVICHHGTAGGGHYTCYAINDKTKQWYELDDQCVTPVPAETVSNCEGYVLFYRKKSDEMKMIRDKFQQLMDKHQDEQQFLDLFISRRWLTRLLTFAEPGPIDNSDFLCPHGWVHPSKRDVIDKLCKSIDTGVWEYLFKNFQGDSACSKLILCPECEEEQQRLMRRRKDERSHFLALKEDNKVDDGQSVIYAVSMVWYREWESFVQGSGAPPDSIDNSPIVTTVNGQKVLKPGSDFAQLNQEMWCFFWDNYGGGPELMIKQPARGSRASFSSGISMERERDRVSASASKAKSTESLPGHVEGVIPRPSRTHSVSSDNVTVKMSAAAVAAAHRKQQSLDNMRLQGAINLEPNCSIENQRKENAELSEGKENDYCPAFTPDGLDDHTPFESAHSHL